MKIGIDISQIVYEGTGVARFTHGLVNAILDHDTENEWIFFVSFFRKKLQSDIEEKIIQSRHRLVFLPLPPTALAFVWNKLHIMNIEALTGELDWFICSDWTEPPAQCKKATIIHDLVFKRYPETVAEKIRATHEKRLEHVVKESELIITDSLATKSDVQDILKIPAEKVHTIYPGVTVQKIEKNRVKTILSTLGITQPFILTVGKIEPRKNLNRLIEAYNSLRKKNPHIPELLIVGPQGWQNIEDLQNDKIRLLGHVSDEELYTLYDECLFFIFPSIWEGFGYPAIEAMLLETPVTLSETSSLQELGEDAALFFDPMKVEDIERALERMITDEQLRKNLVKKGLEKGKEYTWKSYYTQLMKLLAK